MDSFPPNKTIGMGIFVALTLLGLMGFAFFNNTPGSPPPPVNYPTNIPTNQPMKMETFYFTPSPLP